VCEWYLQDYNIISLALQTCTAVTTSYPHHSSYPALACPEPHKLVTHQAHSTLHACCARADATGGYSADYGDEGGYDEDDTATQVWCYCLPVSPHEAQRPLYAAALSPFRIIHLDL
jgi:hypothetical protein